MKITKETYRSEGRDPRAPEDMLRLVIEIKRTEWPPLRTFLHNMESPEVESGVKE